MDRTKKQKIFDKTGMVCFCLCALVSVVAILSITVYLVALGVPGIAKVGVFKFLFGTVWQPANAALPDSQKFGILPMFVGSIYVMAGSVLVGGTLGIFSAIFLARFCPRKIKNVLKQTVNLLAGLPSVIFGFFGMVVIVPFLRDMAKGMGIGNRVTGNGVFASSIVLGIMILPTVLALTLTAMEGQPEGYYDGARALGATKEQATFKVLLPASKSGMLTGIVLGMGRALGETMAVLMVCGGTAAFPDSPFHNMRTLTANIVMEMGYADGLHRDMLLATGLVLFILVMALTVSVNLLRRRKK